MKRIKRMLGILVSLCVLLSQGLSLVCVQAGSNDGAVSLQCLDVCVEVGEQYNNVPAKAQIHLSSDRADGQYELGLFYQNGVSADEIHGEGTADGEGRITMEIPADKAAALQGGVYLVKGTIEGQAVQCEVTLAENTMRQSGVTAETDVIFEDGAGGKKEVSNIFDNMDTNFIAVSGQPYPQIITINYENENTLFAASLYSNYGASFGISNMKLNYRTPEGAWAPVRNKEGGEEFPQSWTTTDQFQRNDLVFDQPYTTTGLQIVVLSSNEAWGESTNISEFQTWGMRKGGVEPPPVKTLKQDAKGSLFSDIMSENETLDALTDKDFSTSFKGTLTTKDYLKFKSPGNTVNRGFVLHASQPQENLKKVTVKVPAHTDDALIELERGLKPVWEPDGHGYKAEFSVDTLAVVPLLWVDLEGQGDIELTEVEWLGDTFTGNILGNAKTTLNGEGFSNAVMTDNNIYSMENFTWEGPAVFEFDFTPGEILADSMYYLTNYGQGQGFKKVKLEGFDGENWKELAAEQEFVWKTSNDLREAQEITFDQTKVSRLRLTILDANHVWGNVTIGELYVHGKEIISAESMAQQITSVKVPARGQERLEMPDLGRFAEDFEVAINFSGDEGVIALDGTIHTPAISKIVELTFLVRSKIDGSTALTASIPVLVLGELSDAVVKTDVAEDTQDVIYNPSMGWVCYIEDCYRNVDPQTGRYNSDLNTVCQGRTVEEYWQEFDGYCEKGLTPHILYIRTVWAWFEPEEGKYAWKDPDSELSRLVKGAEERNLQLAFRVLIDSTDNSEQAVPEWVYEAGARGAVTGADGLKDVYINDPVFLEKFENFLDAFAAEYDNGQTAYIDGFGAGDWGEGNRIMYDSAISSQDEAVRGILDLYNEKIQNVLLGMQHASEADWKYAYENGFVVRRDSFGSPRWFSDSDKKSITGLFAGGNSVFAESCYHGLNHSDGNAGRWQETNQITGWPLSKVLQRVADDALGCRINTLDYRMLSDMECWAEDNPQASAEVARKAGYRIAPTYVAYPREITAGDTLSVEHGWKNTGVGRMPNNNPKWNYKYRVAFAILDSETKEIVKTLTEDKDVDPSEWTMESGEHIYLSEIEIPDTLEDGEYDVACAIVDTSADGQPAINLAATGLEQTSGGWYVLNRIHVNAKGQNPDPAVDKKELQKLYDEHKNDTQGSYTDASWEEFQKALAAAGLVLKDETADQALVDQTKEALETAVKGLTDNTTPKVDKSALQKLFDKYKNMKQGDYTDASRKNFGTAMKNAKTVLGDEKASQTEVDKAKADLETAARNLAKKAASTPDRHSPKTGDKTPIAVMMALLALSGAALLVLGKKRRFQR